MLSVPDTNVAVPPVAISIWLNADVKLFLPVYVVDVNCGPDIM